MKQITIQVEEHKINFLIELLNNFSFVKIKTNEENLDLTDTQKLILQKRYDAYLKNPASFRNWDDVKKEIEKKL